MSISVRKALRCGELVTGATCWRARRTLTTRDAAQRASRPLHTLLSPASPSRRFRSHRVATFPSPTHFGQHRMQAIKVRAPARLAVAPARRERRRGGVAQDQSTHANPHSRSSSCTQAVIVGDGAVGKVSPIWTRGVVLDGAVERREERARRASALTQVPRRHAYLSRIPPYVALLPARTRLLTFSRRRTRSPCVLAEPGSASHRDRVADLPAPRSLLRASIFRPCSTTSASCERVAPARRDGRDGS